MPKKQPSKTHTPRVVEIPGLVTWPVILAGDWSFLLTGSKPIPPAIGGPPPPRPTVSTPTPFQPPYSPNFASIIKARFLVGPGNPMRWYAASNHQGNILGSIPTAAPGFEIPTAGQAGSYRINADGSTGTIDFIDRRLGTLTFSFTLTNGYRDMFLVYTGQAGEDVNNVVWAVGKKD